MAKYHQIAQEIEDMIATGKYGDKLPTLDELAKDFAVSKVTIQRAIKVFQEKNPIGTFTDQDIGPTSTSPDRTHMLGAVLGTHGGSPLHEQLISGMNYQAIKNGEIMAITGGSQNNPDVEVQVIHRVVKNQKVDGVILWPTSGRKTKTPGVKYLQTNNIPFVLLPEPNQELYADCHTVSNFDSEGGSEVMSHLIGCGYRKILFLSQENWQNTICNQHRFQQYQKGMEKAGLEPKEMQYVENLTFSQMKKQDAFFCVNDDTAVGVLNMALEYGIRIPGDVAVSGYDNTTTAMKMNLTSVEQHFEEIGELAVELLLKEIEGKTNGPEHLNVKSELIIRHSTTPSKK